MRPPQLVLMGRASGAFGLKGELRVWSYAQDPQVFVHSGTIYVGPNQESVRPLTVLSMRSSGGRVLLRSRELKSREDAELLKGAAVYIEREALAPLEQGEYYWSDIKNAEVITKDGLKLGRIIKVQNAGAHDLWTVQDDKGREAVIPVIEGVVLEMDTPPRYITLDLPEGLLEAQGWYEPEEAGKAAPAKRPKGEKTKKSRATGEEKAVSGKQAVESEDHDL